MTKLGVGKKNRKNYLEFGSVFILLDDASVQMVLLKHHTWVIPAVKALLFKRVD